MVAQNRMMEPTMKTLGRALAVGSIRKLGEEAAFQRLTREAIHAPAGSMRLKLLLAALAQFEAAAAQVRDS